MSNVIPRALCDRCGEWLPHDCTAPIAPATVAKQAKRASMIEDYLFIGGTVPAPETWRSGVAHGPSAPHLAKRLGVTVRTIQRYRRALREAS